MRLCDLYQSMILLQVAAASAADEMKPVDMPDTSPALGEQAPQCSIIPTQMKIGFLGLGIMGQGMVHNLVRAGHEVTVWNRTNLKVSEFCLKLKLVQKYC